jgi:hypothetical protein
MKALPRLTLAAVLFITAAVPLTVSPGRGLELNGLCADGTCCPERRSICNIGGSDDHTDYYRKAEGSCRLQE